LLAQAAENAPLERDVEWEKQLLDDRRSLYYSRDRTIMDDDAASTVGAMEPIPENSAGVRPAEL
jgi:hypothetical protein